MMRRKQSRGWEHPEVVKLKCKIKYCKAGAEQAPSHLPNNIRTYERPPFWSPAHLWRTPFNPQSVIFSFLIFSNTQSQIRLSCHSLLSKNTLQRDKNNIHLKKGSGKILLFHFCFNGCQNHRWNDLLSFNKQHSADICGGCGGVERHKHDVDPGVQIKITDCI